MAEVKTVRLRTGFVSILDETLMGNLWFQGTFRAHGYHWKAVLEYRYLQPLVTFSVQFNPLKAPSLPDELRARDEKEFVASVSLLNRRGDTLRLMVTSHAVPFIGASGGCFFADICPVERFRSIVLSRADENSPDYADYIIDAKIKLEMKDRETAPGPATPRRQGIRAMFERREMTDVTVIVENTEFLACRFILASQSDVFEAMLSKNWQEGKEGVLRVEDIKPKTMSLLLGYMHLNDVPDNISMEDTVALLLAADKYNIRSLGTTCEALLRKPRESDISADGYQSLLDAFLLASSARKPAVMEAVTKLIKGPARNITKSEEFCKFLVEHPREAAIMVDLLNS